MTYKNKIKRFLELKSDVLGANSKLMYDKNDEKAIDKWKEDECFRVWIRIVYEILIEGNHGLGQAVCPFCIKHNKIYYDECNCKKCEWGKNHGYCHWTNGDYEKMIKLNVLRKFSNKFYKNMSMEVDKDEL